MTSLPSLPPASCLLFLGLTPACVCASFLPSFLPLTHVHLHPLDSFSQSIMVSYASVILALDPFASFDGWQTEICPRGQLMYGLAKTVKDRTEYSSSYNHPPQVQHLSLSELKGSHPFFFHKDNTLSKPGLRSPQPNTSDKCLKQPPNRKSCVI